jgi:hypothetical protein
MKKMGKPRKTKKVPAAATGRPVTLAQVKAIVRARRAPRRALGVKGGGTVVETSPRTVGIARKKLHLQSRREHKARIHDYKEMMMMIMKKRGVKGLSSRAAGAANVHAPRSVNLAKAGDEVRFMLGVEERKIIEKQLRDGCPAGGPWDVLLFSGGGNDIIDNPMALWVRDFNPSVPPPKLINQPRYDAALALLQAGYEDLITLRDTLSPGTHLVFHAYDYAIPDGRGVCFLGPWLKPTFDLRKFPSNSTTAFEVVKEMLKQFEVLLETMESTHAGITIINGQGTLIPKASSWHNELHPSKDGFNKFAKLFHQKLRALFPSRVL